MYKFLASCAIAIALTLSACGTSVNDRWYDTSVVSVSGNCTGVVVDADKGLVLTAGHCVQPSFYVETVDGKRSPATLMWASTNDDLALIRVTTPAGMGLTESYIAWADPQVGEKVWTVGYPMTVGRAYAEGKVVRNGLTAPDNHTYTVVSLTCTYGCSGSPIFNESHQIIGILTGVITVPSGLMGRAMTDYIIAVPASQISQHF